VPDGEGELGMRARGIEIATKVTGTGDGPTLLWGHALMGSMRQEEAAGIMPWAGLRAETSLVRWDARGHGASEATLADEDYRWSELATDLWAIADGLGIDEAVVGGISMGAGTALHAATLAPERTRGLVLMAPPTAWNTRPRQSRLYESTARMIDRIGLGPLRFFGELAGRMARNSALGRLQRSVMRGLRKADARAVQAALRGAALSDLPTAESLEKLDVPTLILAWPKDWSHPLSTAEALAARLPNARLEVAGKTGEVEAWPELLQAFLESICLKAPPGEPKRTHSLQG
jgi:3-oxoadipate enol-lactonase